MTITLKDDALTFEFPEVHPEATFSLEFQRTLRIPDDGNTYPLPPGLGRFPLRHVHDFSEHVPPEWRERQGVMLPMYQSEALWIASPLTMPPAGAQHTRLQSRLPRANGAQSAARHGLPFRARAPDRTRTMSSFRVSPGWMASSSSAGKSGSSSQFPSAWGSRSKPNWTAKRSSAASSCRCTP